MDLDYVIPFAAVPENDREIDGLDDKSELAHRIMLVNLLRLLGAVKIKKASRHFVTRPTQVILPLSPNHGLFGNDGLYSESKISLLNSQARATYNAKTGSYALTSKLSSEAKLDTGNAQALSQIVASSATSGVGVDQELISSVPSWNPTFVERNFTDAEAAYCRSQPSPPASFAARWVGKEAVFKALGVSSKGAAAPMKDIEILPDESGVPTVSLHGDAKSAAESGGISKVLVSLSHSETTAIAFAQTASA